MEPFDFLLDIFYMGLEDAMPNVFTEMKIVHVR